MTRFFKPLLTVFLLTIGLACQAKSLPALYLFLGGDGVMTNQSKLNHPCVRGAQIIYSWKQLEPRKGVYDFSKIETDLTWLNNSHKKLFIQLQDRSFTPTVFNVPDYIRNDPIYHGGVAKQYDVPGEGKAVTIGWVARVWDPAVRERFQLLMQKLAAEFDGRIAGINLPETAVDFDEKKPPFGFTPDQYFAGELTNLEALRNAFHNSMVMQYVNFFPGEWQNDHHYMSRLFSYASQHQISLGGPDAVPDNPNQMKNSYPFFHAYQGELYTGIAIQEPDYTYRNPNTGKYYQFSDFYDFTQHYLGADILFWNVQEPFFTDHLSPQLDNRHFICSRD